MRTSTISRVSVLAGALCAACLQQTAAGQSFRWIGVLPGYEVLTAQAMSADGRVIVGHARSLANNQRRAFRWSADGGLQSLGVLPGGESSFIGSAAYDVSDDGSVIVGESAGSMGTIRTFRWTAETGMSALPLPPGVPLNTAAGSGLVSGDGRVVLGSLNSSASPAPFAFTWTAEGGSQLFNIPQWAIPRKLTYNGSAVLGHERVGQNSYAAVRWTLSGGRTVLLPDVWVSCINADGTAMHAQRPDLSWQFWTAARGFQSLEGHSGPTGAYFGNVTPDGSLFVGQVSSSTGATAMVWSPTAGASTTENFLRRHGVQLPPDAVGQLRWTVDISADGRTLMGQGELRASDTLSYTGVWVATIPICGSADFDNDGQSGTDADIEAFFACLGGHCCPLCWAKGSDFNGDGDTGTDQDIEAFFRVLGGGGC
ncbi:MAG TPA: hypothetical protein VD997_14755 [Phycisphaerales bacterium]|nr:hypothetical protein [Phycisphaerales bacterium]